MPLEAKGESGMEVLALAVELKIPPPNGCLISTWFEQGRDYVLFLIALELELSSHLRPSLHVPFKRKGTVNIANTVEYNIV